MYILFSLLVLFCFWEHRWVKDFPPFFRGFNVLTLLLVLNGLVSALDSRFEVAASFIIGGKAVFLVYEKLLYNIFIFTILLAIRMRVIKECNNIIYK